MSKRSASHHRAGPALDGRQISRAITAPSTDPDDPGALERTLVTVLADQQVADEPADERADDSEQDRLRNAHRVATRNESTGHESGNQAGHQQEK